MNTQTYRALSDAGKSQTFAVLHYGVSGSAVMHDFYGTMRN